MKVALQTGWFVKDLTGLSAWLLKIHPLAAGGPRSLTLTSGNTLPCFASVAMHCGTLCKPNMAAACARTLGKVGWSLLESPAARRPGTVSYLVGNVGAHGSRRAFGTGGTGARSKLLSSLRAGVAGGRALGCAFLLGGGLGLYQTVKFSLQQHLAEEETKVSPVQFTCMSAR